MRFTRRSLPFLFCLAAPVAAQERPVLLTLSGQVLDAASARPIPGATIRLVQAGAGPRVTRSDSLGSYTVHGLAPGEYDVDVRALGFAPTRVELTLAAASAMNVSVGLLHQPLYLRRVDVRRERSATFLDGGTGTDGWRVTRERDRQRRFPSPDARVISAPDLDDAIAPAGPDLLRALQRLPGVGARDDYSAELWTRGAPWSQTGVTFDGVPLFNPMHAAGAVSAINPDALGEATFHPGAQPIGPGGGAAGLLSLTSRSGSGTDTRQSAGISVLSTSVAADGPIGGRTTYMAAVRRSHVDVFAHAIAAARNDSSARLPYAFSDLTFRVDHALGDRWHVAASAIGTRNTLSGRIPEVVHAGRAQWGSSGARASVAAQLGEGRLEHTVGGSRFAAWGEPALAGEAAGDVYHVQSTDNAVRHAFVQGEWQSTTLPAVNATTLGYRLGESHARYFTAGDWPRDSLPNDTLRHAGGIRLLSAWGERRLHAGPVAARVGAQVDAGGQVAGAPGLRLSPQASARWAVDTLLTVAASYARSWQYEQTFAPGAAGRHALATSGMFWMIAGGNVPALRSDLTTIGAERWLDARTLTGVTGYVRRSSGLVMPAPHGASAGDRPRWVHGAQRARGIELVARRLSGRITGSTSYSYQQSELEALGVRFDAPWERRHLAQIAGMARVLPSLHAGAALAASTGAPFTSFFDGVADCDSVAGRCTWSAPPMIGDASAAREPIHRSLDLAMQWTRAWESRHVVVYATVRNVLGTRNPAAYLQSRCRQSGGSADSGACTDAVHERLQGLERLPAAGVRFTF